MDRLRDGWDALLGISAESLTLGQTAIRTVLAFVVLTALLRLGDKRLMGRGSAFDLVVAFMIGSIMSFSITRPGSVIRIYLAVALLIGLHTALSRLAARVEWFGPLVKGRRVRLVRDGEIRREAMIGSGITDNDLMAALRGEGEAGDLDLIRDAWLERDGSISIRTRSAEPRVVEVGVREGVQTVRVELE